MRATHTTARVMPISSLVVAIFLAAVTSASAQGLPGLEARVAALEAANQPLDITVNCGAGESVQAALAQGTGRSARLIVRINGTCTEAVSINRDFVLVVGNAPGDGLQAPVATANVINVFGKGVILRQLTLHGGQSAIVVRGGAGVFGDGLEITGTVQSGANVDTGGRLELANSAIRNSGAAGASS